jgi:hypothetical protein
MVAVHVDVTFCDARLDTQSAWDAGALAVELTPPVQVCLLGGLP